MATRTAQIVVLTVLLSFPIQPLLAGAEPLHLLFWQGEDVCEARNVDFRVHPVSAEESRILLPADPARSSLWFSPTDAVPIGEEVRVYYQRVEKSQESYVDQRTWCLGLLRPPGQFVLPDLGLFPQSWEGPHNVVLQRSPHPPTWGGFNVFQMVGDATRGYRELYWDQPSEGEAGATIASSTDGIHWKKDEDRTVFTEHNDAYSLVENRTTGDYLLYQTRLQDWPEKPFVDNLPGKRRVISLRRSRDLVTWSPQEDILVPDGRDAPSTEFYLFKVFHHIDRYVGLLMKYYGDPEKPGKHSAIMRYELAFSPDGLSWRRPYRSTDFGTWTYATPFDHEGRLCLVCYQKEGITLYRMRQDGFASCGSDSEGSFWTKPFEVGGSETFLNADCRDGEVSVAVLDEKGLVLEGFEGSLCRFVSQDGNRIPLRWNGRSLSDLEGRTVHLELAVRNARVYSMTEE